MTELTIQVPDELAMRLEPLRDRLPELLLQLLGTTQSSLTNETLNINNLTNITPVYMEVIDFLMQRPTTQEIATFKVSAQAQTYLQNLLEKNSEGTLTTAEYAELDVYEQLEQLMILLKARAYAAIK